jgi:transposase
LIWPRAFFWFTRLMRPARLSFASRRHPHIAAIALANKIGRIAWALMTSGERYREPGRRMS